MPYHILQHKEEYYPPAVIAAAFSTLTKYRKQLLQYIRERPHLPLAADEAYSDLIIYRMPRFISNCSLGLSKIQEIVKHDISAARSKSKYVLNTMKEPTAEQREHLTYLHTLIKPEKQFLTFLRSCTRRTKIKYLQSYAERREKGQIVETLDPTNGMLQIRENQETAADAENCRNLEELFDKLELPPSERQILEDIILEDMNFTEAAALRRVSPNTVSRMYRQILAECRHVLQVKEQNDVE